MPNAAKKSIQVRPYSFTYPQSIWIDPKDYKTKIFLEPSEDNSLSEVIFIPETGQASFKREEFIPSPLLTLEDISDISDILPKVTSTLIAHSILGKIGYAHPGAKGLVPKSLIQKAKKAPLVNALYRPLANQKEKEFLNIIPKEWDNNFGWFPTDSEGKIFGNLYLAPYSDALERKTLNAGIYSFSEFNQNYYWALFHKDFKVQLGRALWNDLAGIEALIQRANANDGDVELTQQALLNPTLMRADTIRIAQKKSLEAAREAFKLTPIRVKEIKQVSTNIWEASRGLFSNKLNFYSNVTLNFHTLNNDSIYRVDRSEPKAVNAAAEIDLEELDEGLVRHFLNNLDSEIKKRNLGDILVSDSPRRVLYITRNVEAFLAHREIFFNLKPFTYYSSRNMQKAPRIGIDENLRSPEAFINEVLEPSLKAKKPA